MLRLGVHAGLPRVPGHLGHGEEQEGNAGEEEEDEAAAGAGEGPAVVILHPDRVLALDHAFDRLAHHLQGDEGAEAWGGKEGKAGCERHQSVDGAETFAMKCTDLRKRKTCRQV